MEHDDLLDDGQAQSRAAGGPGPGLVHPVEPVEYVDQIRLGNADARIGHRHPGHSAVAADLRLHKAPLRGILDGVVHQVIEHLAQLLGVPGSLDLVLYRHFQANIPLLRQGPQPPGGIVHQLVQLQQLGLELHAPAIDMHQGEQIAHDGVEPVDLPVDVAQEFPGHIRVVGLLVQQRLQQDLHGRQGRLQFVGGVGHELIAALVQAFQALAHHVERLRQLGELVVPPHRYPAGQIAVGHALNALGQFRDGPGENPRHHHRQQQHRHRHQQKPYGHALLHLGQAVVYLLGVGQVQHHPLQLASLTHGGGVHPQQAVGLGPRTQSAQKRGAAAAQVVKAVGTAPAGEHVVYLLDGQALAVGQGQGIGLDHPVLVQHHHPSPRLSRHAGRLGVQRLGVPAGQGLGHAACQILGDPLFLPHFLGKQIFAHQLDQGGGHQGKGHADDQQVGDDDSPTDGVQAVFNPCR